MTISRTAVAVALGCLLLALAASDARAQCGKPGAQGMPPMPKPGPEHALLKDDVGTWDAVVETFMAPGAPPTKSKGVETNTMGCGGLCLITDFKGEMGPGMPFEGHGMSTWDPAKKKYVGVWSDSMSFGLGTGETTWDPKTRTVTGYMEGADASGKTTRMKSVVEYKGADGRVFRLYGPGEGGKEAVMMTITYTRRK